MTSHPKETQIKAARLERFLDFGMGFLKAGFLGDFIYSQQANIIQVSSGRKFLSISFHALNGYYIHSSLILAGPSCYSPSASHAALPPTSSVYQSCLPLHNLMVP